MKTVWKVLYCAGPENLERALNESDRDWVIHEVLSHPGAEPRYTLLIYRFETKEGDSSTTG